MHVLKSFSKSNSEIVDVIALYSASADEFETIVCFIDFHDTKQFPKKIHNPILDFIVSKQQPNISHKKHSTEANQN